MNTARFPMLPGLAAAQAKIAKQPLVAQVNLFAIATPSLARAATISDPGALVDWPRRYGVRLRR